MKKNVSLDDDVDINKNDRDELDKAKSVPSKNDTEKKKPTKIVDVKPVVLAADIQIKVDKFEVDRVSEKKLSKEEVLCIYCFYDNLVYVAII